MTAKNRDTFLDVAKGLAIMVVVAGHTIQANVQNPDANFFFRLICSFQMPMFIFISGMVASLKVRSFFPAETLHDLLCHIIDDVWSSTVRLFIPFVSWTILFYFIFFNDGTLTYFKNVLKSPDYSLWFLLALFYCKVFLSIICFFVSVVRTLISKSGQRLSSYLDNGLLAFILISTVFFIYRKHGLDLFGLGFLKYLFPYYFLGIYFYRYMNKIPYLIVMQIFCFIVFFAFVPFWHRLEPGVIEGLLSEIITPGKARLIFSTIVAISGTLSFLLLAKIVAGLNIPPANRFITFCGRETLGIYAIHCNLAWLPPPFIAPLCVGLFGSWLIGKIPMVRFFFLGQRFFR